MYSFWKAVLHDTRRMLNKRVLLFSIITSALYTIMQGSIRADGTSVTSVIMNMFGGFVFEEIIVFQMDNLLIHALLLLTFWYSIGDSMQEEYSVLLKDTLYRFKSYRSWYVSKCIASVITCAVLCLTMMVGILISCGLLHVEKISGTVALIEGFPKSAYPYCLLAIGMFFLNAVMLSQFAMVIHLITGNLVFSFSCYLLPILLGLYGSSNTFEDVRPLYHPINWGMLLRSNLMSDPGFPLLLGIGGQVAIALLAFLVGIFLCPKLNIALRCRQTE